MADLYELASEIAAIIAEADANGGELPVDAEQRLDALGGDISAKVERLDRWRRNLESDVVQVKSEAGRLNFLAARLSRRIDWLESYIRRGMDLAGVRKLGGATWGVSICANSVPTVTIGGSVVVDELPAKFRTETRTVVVDKKAIASAHANGETLPNGVTVSRGTHMRFT